MFKNVIAGYEGSPGSEDALALALLLAAHDAHLTAACSYWQEPLSARIGKGDPGAASMRAAALELLAPLASRHPELELAAVPGASPARALHDFAESREADLLAVGATTRGRIGRALGSTAERLLHGAPCAIAVAPAGFASSAPGALRRVGAAYCPEPEGEFALTAGHRIAGETGAAFEVIAAFDAASYETVMTDPVGITSYRVARREAAVADLQDALEGLTGEPAPEKSFIDGPPFEVISERATSLDLLVMGSRAFGPAKRALLGSTSHAILLHPPCPVLILPRAAAVTAASPAASAPA